MTQPVRITPRDLRRLDRNAVDEWLRTHNEDGLPTNATARAQYLAKNSIAHTPETWLVTQPDAAERLRLQREWLAAQRQVGGVE